MMPPSLARRNEAPRVDPEFQSLIAPLTPEEHRQLESNIAAEGCRDALVVWNRLLLDGHNRFEICTRLGVRYKISQVELKSREEARIWIEENQIGRRNLSQDQRAAIAYRILQRRIAISKKQRARKGGLRLVTACTTEKKPRERERTAKQLGISSRQVRLVAEIVKHSPEMLERIVAGKLTIKEAKGQLIEQTRQAKREAAIETNSKGNCVYTGHLSILNRLIPDNSADLFLTDPPYDRKSIGLYGKLAELAQRKLKPGGLCAVMCGQLFFDQVFAEMTKHLDYWWLCGISGNEGARSTRILNRRVLNVFRVVLIFSKRTLTPMAQSSLPMMLDLIPGVRDKQHHTWGQGLKQFQYLVENLSEPGELVVDPFVGGGTVPVACVASGRRYIATEIDPGVAAAARARVAEFRKSQSKAH